MSRWTALRIVWAARWHFPTRIQRALFIGGALVALPFFHDTHTRGEA